MAKKKISKGEQTRVKIIKSAIKLFSENGYSETSFQDIANHSGVKHSNILYHFGDKLNLVKLVIEHIRENYNQGKSKVSIENNGLLNLLYYCIENMTWALRSPNEARVYIFLYYLATNQKRFQPVMKEFIETGEKSVLSQLLIAKQEKLISENIDLKIAASDIHSHLLGQGFKKIAMRTRYTKQIMRDFEENTKDFLTNYFSLKSFPTN